MSNTRNSYAWFAAVLAAFAAPGYAQPIEETIADPVTHEATPTEPGARWAASLDLLVWPSLTDLQPQTGGSFDSLGFGLEGSFHMPVAQLANSELLLGVDLMFGGTDSGINATYEQLIARQFYLGGSVKWAFGEARNVALDAGIGYHEVDMADVSYNWWTTYENEHWSGEEASWFVGATWDVGAGRPGKSSGLSIGFRVHFVDFGRVSDADRLGVFPVLGPDAGTLEGPLYMLKVGYSGR
jgi:hypothetical protein